MVLPQTAAALALPGVAGTAIGILQALNIDPLLIEQIATTLNKHHDAVLDGKPEGTDPSAFGQSDAGGYLAHHTSIAERHVVDAMTEMAEALLGYGEAVRRFADDAEETDLQAKHDMEQLTELIVSTRIGQEGGDH